MAESRTRIEFVADATQMRKSVEAQMKNLSFSLADAAFKGVRSRLDTEFKKPFTINIQLNDSKKSLQAFGKITNEISGQFDKIGAASTKLSSSIANQFPKMVAHVNQLGAALTTVAGQINSIGNAQILRGVGGGGGGGGAPPQPPAGGAGGGGNQNNIRQLNAANRAVAQYQQQVQQLTRALHQAQNAQHQFAQTTGTTARRLAAYLIPATAIFQLTRGLGVARDQIVDINKQITQLTQIMGGNARQAEQVAEDVLRVARNMGQSGTEILKITQYLAQSGDKFSATSGSLQQAAQAIAASNLGATFGNIEETTEGAIAYLNQFNKSGEELIDILDSANVLARDFAVEAKDIFGAVKAGGAVFANIGGDIREFQALVTAIRSITRLSFPTIGTGISSSTLKLFRSANLDVLRDLGIDVESSSGDLKGFIDIMRQLGQALRDVDEGTRINIAEQIFGVHGARVSIALINDFGKEVSEVDKALKAAANSTGSIFRDANIGLGRIDVQFNQVLANFQEFLKEIASDKSFLRLVKEITSVLNVLVSTLKEVNTLGGLLGDQGGLIPSLLRIGGAGLLGLAGAGARTAFRAFRTARGGDGINPGSPGALAGGGGGGGGTTIIVPPNGGPPIVQGRRPRRLFFNSPQFNQVIGAGPYTATPAPASDLNNPRNQLSSFQTQLARNIAEQTRLANEQRNFDRQDRARRQRLIDKNVAAPPIGTQDIINFLNRPYRGQGGKFQAPFIESIRQTASIGQLSKAQSLGYTKGADILSLLPPTQVKQVLQAEVRKRFPPTGGGINTAPLTSFLATQPKGFEDVMRSNIEDGIKKYGKKYAQFVGSVGIADPNNKAKLDAYRVIAQQMGYDIGPVTENRNAHNITAPLIPFNTPRPTGGGIPIAELRKFMGPGNVIQAEQAAIKQERSQLVATAAQYRKELGAAGFSQQTINKALVELVAPMKALKQRSISLAAAQAKLEASINATQTQIFRQQVNVGNGLPPGGPVPPGGRLNIPYLLGRGAGRLRNFARNNVGGIGFAGAIGLDLLAQNAISENQGLFNLSPEGNVIPLSSQDIQNRSSSNINRSLGRGALSGAGMGLAVGAAFGPIGAGIGVIAGAAIGAIGSYNSALKENRDQILQTVAAAKGFTEAGKALSNAFSQVGGSILKNADEGDYQAALADGSPASLAALQGLRSSAIGLVAEIGNRGLTDDQIRLESARRIREGVAQQLAIEQPDLKGQELTDEIERRTSAIISFSKGYVTSAIDASKAQKATQKRFEELTASIQTFMDVLNKEAENLNLQLSSLTGGRNLQRGAIGALSDAGGFNTADIAGSLDKLFQDRFRLFAERGDINRGNVRDLSFGLLSPEQESQAVFFSDLSGNLESLFRDIISINEQFGGSVGGLGEVSQRIRQRIDEFSFTGDEITTEQQRKLFNAIIDQVTDATEGPNLEKFDKQTADSLRNKILGAVSPFEDMAAVVAGKLGLLGDQLDLASEKYKQQVIAVEALRQATSQDVTNRFERADRLAGIGVGSDRTLAAIRAAGGLIGNTDVGGTGARLLSAQQNFAGVQQRLGQFFGGASNPEQIRNLINNAMRGGNATLGGLLDEARVAQERLDTAQRDHNDALQNATLRLNQLSREFSIYQSKLNESIQTNAGLGRATITDVFQSRLAVGQARGMGLFRGLNGITELNDVRNLNQDTVASMARLFASVPDSIAQRISAGAELQGANRLFSGALSGNQFSEIFNVLRGIGRSGDVFAASGEFQQRLKDIFDKDKEIADLQKRNVDATVNMAKNIEKIADRILTLDFSKIIPQTPTGNLPSPTNAATTQPSQRPNLLGNTDATVDALAEAVRVLDDTVRGSSSDMSLFIENLNRFNMAMLESRRQGKTEVEFKGDFNVVGFENVGKDTAAAAMIIKVMQAVADQLNSSDPAQAKLRDSIQAAIRQIESGR